MRPKESRPKYYVIKNGKPYPMEKLHWGQKYGIVRKLQELYLHNVRDILSEEAKRGSQYRIKQLRMDNQLFYQEMQELKEVNLASGGAEFKDLIDFTLQLRAETSLLIHEQTQTVQELNAVEQLELIASREPELFTSFILEMMRNQMDSPAFTEMLILLAKEVGMVCYKKPTKVTGKQAITLAVE